jgi:hypothetical protein
MMKRLKYVGVRIAKLRQGKKETVKEGREKEMEI